MQVRRSPTARCTSAAATAESTPPESAQMTRPSEPVARACASTRARISDTVDSMKLAGVQVGRAPAMPRTKLRSRSRPRGRVDDLGVELDAVETGGRRRPGPRTASSPSAPSAGSPPGRARSSRRGSSRRAARAASRRTAAAVGAAVRIDDLDAGRTVLAASPRRPRRRRARRPSAGGRSRSRGPGRPPAHSPGSG